MCDEGKEMTKPTVSTTEAAELMHVGPQYVLDLIDAGVLNAAKLGKREAWLVKSTA